MAGTIVISIEVELAWGVHHLPGQQGMDRHSPRGQRERQFLKRLLTLCDDLDLPISFDVVGHLLLERCRGRHDGPHETTWFDRDPGTDLDRDPLFYAPDIVTRIRDAAVEHEICTHTFSHIRCDEVPESVLDWELDAVEQAHAAFGLPAPVSLVPPVHGPPALSTLADHGIEVTRRPVRYEPPVGSTPESWPQQIAQTIRRPYPVQVLARQHPVCEPDVIEGIVQTHSTWHTSLTAPYLPSGQQDVHPIFRQLPMRARRWLHERYLRRGLETAVERDSHAHFWCHLFDLANDAQWAPIASFLRRLAASQAEGDARVVPMAALGEMHD